MTPEQIVRSIDAIARAYDEYEFGLPLLEIEEFDKFISLITKFGKQCFEAGRDSKKIYKPEKDGKLELITIIIEYKSFEDYLKSLENE